MKAKKKSVVGYMHKNWLEEFDRFPNIRPRQFYIPPCFARGDIDYEKVRITIERL